MLFRTYRWMIYLVLASLPLVWFALFALIGAPLLDSIVGAAIIGLIFIPLGLSRLGILQEEFRDDEEMTIAEARGRLWGFEDYGHRVPVDDASSRHS